MIKLTTVPSEGENGNNWCGLQTNKTREALKKGKAQYSWPPH